MSTFVIVTWNGGGNTTVTYRLARALSARGHALTLLGQGSQVRAAEDLGARFVPLPVPDWPPGTALEEDPGRLFNLIFSPQMGQVVFDTLAAESPDMVVIDCMLTSSLAAAESAQVRLAALVPVLYQQFVLGNMGRRWAAAMPLINTMRRGFGLPPRSSPSNLLDPLGAVIVASVQDFDVPMAHLPKNVHYVGPFLDDNASGVPSPWPEGVGRPRVLISFSTSMQRQEGVVQRLMSALAALPVQAVFTTGPALHPERLPHAANVRVLDYLPHAAALPECALLITHGGLGTLMGALSHGVPLLCLPLGRDQHDNTARVIACGAGLALPKDASVDQLSHTIAGMLVEPKYAQAARQMATSIAAHNGLERTIDLLETCATRPLRRTAHR